MPSPVMAAAVTVRGQMNVRRDGNTPLYWLVPSFLPSCYYWFSLLLRFLIGDQTKHQALFSHKNCAAYVWLSDQYLASLKRRVLRVLPFWPIPCVASSFAFCFFKGGRGEPPRGQPHLRRYAPGVQGECGRWGALCPPCFSFSLSLFLLFRSLPAALPAPPIGWPVDASFYRVPQLTMFS